MGGAGEERLHLDLVPLRGRAAAAGTSRSEPVFEGNSEEWSEPRAFEKVLEAHIQDTHENNNDPVHFLYVHGATGRCPDSEISYTPDSTHYRISSSNEIEYPFGTFKMTLVRDSWGLGLNCMEHGGHSRARG